MQKVLENLRKKLEQDCCNEWLTILDEHEADILASPAFISAGKILENDYTARAWASFWAKGGKLRLYVNVQNTKGYKYPLKQAYYECIS